MKKTRVENVSVDNNGRGSKRLDSKRLEESKNWLDYNTAPRMRTGKQLTIVKYKEGKVKHERQGWSKFLVKADSRSKNQSGLQHFTKNEDGRSIYHNKTKREKYQTMANDDQLLER